MSEQLKVALVQSHLLWENPSANRKMLEEKIKSMSNDVDVIILPEMFTTGFTMSPENIAPQEGHKTMEWMCNMSLESEAAIMGSTVFTENGKNYNRLLFVTPEGTFHQYNKKHTFTLAGENRVYEAGNERMVLTYKNFRICPLICYDLRFPVWARNTVDYDVLIYVANWPKPRVTAWDTLLKARAIENMSYCIGVNRIGMDELGHEYAGHSAVYNTLGEQIAYSEKETVLYATLEKQHITACRSKLKFLDDRDAFNLI